MSFCLCLILAQYLRHVVLMTWPYTNAVFCHAVLQHAVICHAVWHHPAPQLLYKGRNDFSDRQATYYCN